MKTKKPFFKTLLVGLVFTLLGCTEENYYTTTTADGLGKVNVYIEGDITDAECAAKLAEEVGSLTENIYIGGSIPLTNLTNIEVIIPTSVKSIIFNGGESLKNIKITGSGKMPYSTLKVEGGENLQNVLITGITELFTFTASCYTSQYSTTIVCEDLEIVHRNMNVSTSPTIAQSFICDDLKYIDKNNQYSSGINVGGYFSNFSMSGLIEIGNKFWISLYGSDLSFTSLEKVNILEVYSFANNTTTNSLNFPSLTSISDYLKCYADRLGTLNLPVLNTCLGIDLRDSELPVLNFNAPALNYCTYYKSNIGLNTTGVNTVLNKFLNIQPVSGKYIDLIYEVAPTGQGLTDKNTLIIQGNTVYTN